MRTAPRFDIQELQPWEVMFADEKEFPTLQRGGTKTSFILLEMKSDACVFKAETSKTQHGNSFRKIVVENGVHLGVNWLKMRAWVALFTFDLGPPHMMGGHREVSVKK